MWPSVLDMTRDECRGILRRLELEAYSSVVSTFRAQGGLSDGKTKLLEELRNVFHITTDRHRAEARRVANDEKLCTIAETISGPNTTQEWSREGRRPFPLLPRAAPFTAFSAVANGVAEIVQTENSKLPYPSETTRVRALKSPEATLDAKPVVQKDPAHLSAEEKRNLKRTHQISETVPPPPVPPPLPPQPPQQPQEELPSSPISKPRTISGGSQSPQHLPLQTSEKIQQLYHSHSKTQSRHKRGIQKRNSGTPKSMKTPLAISQGNKTPISASKPIKASSDLPITANKNNLPISRNLHTYASLPQPSVAYDSYTTPDKQAKIIAESQEIASSNWPQIATSKKDITNNLSKLNMMANSQLHSGNINIVDTANKVDSPIASHLSTPDGRSPVNNVTTSSPIAWSTKPPSIPAVGQRITLKPSPNVIGSVAKQPGNKSLQQHQPSPSSAISLASGYININPKPIKAETASIVTINERKELEVANPNVMTVTTFARQDSQSIVESPSSSSSSTGHIRSTPTIIGSGNFDLKTNTESGTIQMVTASSGLITAKPKIQIHSQQTFSPGYGSIKLPVGMQLKGVTGRKTVQLFSSPSGKMFIQSADSSKSQSQKGLSVANSAAGGTAIGVAGTNRYALQKVQIVSPSTPIKQISLNKSEMILMPGNVLSTVSNSGNVVVRGLPMAAKQNNRLSAQIVSKPSAVATTAAVASTHDLSGSGILKNQNVIVIGAVPTEKAVKTPANRIASGASMITEDTPVDILTTPLENAVQLSPSAAAIKGVAPTKYAIKPPITVLQTIGTASGNDDSSGNSRSSNHHKSQSQPQIALQSTEVVETASMDGGIEPENTFVMSSTDWEVELDQHTSKSRNTSDQTVVVSRSRQAPKDDSVVFSDDEMREEVDDSSQQIIDNFNDVIEEDTIDDDSILNETTIDDDDDEYDTTYGSMDLDDSVAIEYIDANNSSEMVIEEYTDSGKEVGGTSVKSTKVVSMPRPSTLIYSASKADCARKVKSVNAEGQGTSSLAYDMEENGLKVNR